MAAWLQKGGLVYDGRTEALDHIDWIIFKETDETDAKISMCHIQASCVYRRLCAVVVFDGLLCAGFWNILCGCWAGRPVGCRREPKAGG
jgi:hypothetical protein